MLMKPEHIRRLCELSARGTNSPAVTLILSRRYARHFAAQQVIDRERYWEALKEAERGLPFTASKIKELKTARRETTRKRRKNMAGIADWLRQWDEVILALYGFGGVCDLLGVNPVHREEAREYADKSTGTITAIAFISGLEDSASVRSGRNQPDFKDGPLFHAFMAQMEQLMIDRPGCMPDPTAPGGPLYGLPTYMRQPDGTMVMNRPTVTVHSADGSSKVIKGKPGVRRG
ncbi:hypothetical protein [Pseudomonas fluorescens]|uniref:hypothetical protein n=1 Tax=Pseudomonas fluorescens TaxID=294 RepID=UPI000F4862A6|nr:hypothetical protein [Pseudomonas fluorescens]RON90392.1 hypothetical protein BK668_11875 [Pseudomonas fluorescens]